MASKALTEDSSGCKHQDRLFAFGKPLYTCAGIVKGLAGAYNMTVRSLERDGLLTRELFPEVPPRVEYEQTALGRSLLLPM